MSFSFCLCQALSTIAVECCRLPSVAVCWCDGFCRPLPLVAVCWRPPPTDCRSPYGCAPPRSLSVSSSSSSRLPPCSSQDLGKNPTASLQGPALGFRLFASFSRLHTNLDASWVSFAFVCCMCTSVVAAALCTECSCGVRSFLDCASPACKLRREGLFCLLVWLGIGLLLWRWCRGFHDFLFARKSPCALGYIIWL